MTETDAIGQFNAVAEVRSLSFDLFSGLSDNVRANSTVQLSGIFTCEF